MVKKLWVVDQQGATAVFLDRRSALRFAKAEAASGADDLTIGSIPLNHPKLLSALADTAVSVGATGDLKRLTPSVED